MYSAPVWRCRRISMGWLRRLVAGLFLIPLIVYFFIRALLLIPGQPLIVNSIRQVTDGFIKAYQKEPLRIVQTAMPLLGCSSFEGDGGRPALDQVFFSVFEVFGRVNLYSPETVLKSQIPLVAAMDLQGVAVGGSPSYVAPGSLSTEKTVAVPPGECLVCIYNTHTGETYGRTDGVERLDGGRGGVVTVAAALQDELENKYGVKVSRSDRINDACYNTSYLESEKTARELLDANPKARAILDIHRDSGKTREQSIVNTGGEEAAIILFVVGTDTRRPFPNWRQNYAFATGLSDKLNEKYPGLSQGVRVKDGIYNQSLHPGAVLVEIGSTENTTEEAVRSARLLAGILAGFIAGEE